MTTINESEGISFSALFSDPGFDNPLNPNAAMPPSITDPLNESFTYDIDWGDGRQEELCRRRGRYERFAGRALHGQLRRRAHLRR